MDPPPGVWSGAGVVGELGSLVVVHTPGDGDKEAVLFLPEVVSAPSIC